MTPDGFVTIESVHRYSATVARLDAALLSCGITPILRLDHAAAAAAAGLPLRPILLVLFGDPKVGTGFMQEQPTAGIDLPLKLLVWEDDAARVRIGYNDPAWIKTRHGVDRASDAASKMAALLAQLASAAGTLS